MMVSLRSRPICDRSYQAIRNECEQRYKGLLYLYIIALVIVATFSKQSMVDNAMYIQLVEQRVAILGNGGCEDYHLIQLADPLHELVDARSLDHIDVVILSFDLHRYREVSLVKYLLLLVLCRGDQVKSTHLEATVHQCLVQIQHKTLLALEFRPERP